MSTKSVKEKVRVWCDLTSSGGKRPTATRAAAELGIGSSAALRHVNGWLADHPDIKAIPDGRHRVTKDALKAATRPVEAA